MPCCSSCGSPIPEGQGSSCSMCYGDPFYGKDGYYMKWIEEEEEKRQRKEEEEKETQEERDL
jgi:hypothetical protein